jgi:hypothetical protein
MSIIIEQAIIENRLTDEVLQNIKQGDSLVVKNLHHNFTVPVELEVVEVRATEIIAEYEGKKSVFRKSDGYSQEKPEIAEDDLLIIGVL